MNSRRPGDKVRLVLTHKRLETSDTVLSVSGGWHTHLDILVDVLDGQQPKRILEIAGEVRGRVHCATRTSDQGSLFSGRLGTGGRNKHDAEPDRERREHEAARRELNHLMHDARLHQHHTNHRKVQEIAKRNRSGIDAPDKHAPRGPVKNSETEV